MVGPRSPGRPPPVAGVFRPGSALPHLLCHLRNEALLQVEIRSSLYSRWKSSVPGHCVLKPLGLPLFLFPDWS